MSELRSLAIAIAEEAGALLLERFAEPARGLDSKTSATDMVSDADRDAEALIVQRILGARPDDGVLGEEHGERAGTSGVRWIVDPLDGTTNFLYGIPQWCVSIACEDASGTLAGVVRDPVRDETFAAECGGGAWLGDRRIAVSRTTELAHALVATGFGYRVQDREIEAVAVARVIPRARDIRRFGAAALDLAWVACGRVDAYYEGMSVPLHAWDVAAGSLLVAEAGGVLSGLPGGGILASAPGISQELSDLLHGT